MINKSDDYAEFSVKSGNTSAGGFIWVLGIAAAICGFIIVLMINAMLPGNYRVILGTFLIALYICAGLPLIFNLCKKKDVEYDYLYIENDLEIDAIYNKSKRKRVITIHMEHAKKIAPKGSQAVLGYEGRGNLLVKDFTSEALEKTPYAIILEKDNKVVEVLVEPDEHMLSLMKYNNKDVFCDE